MAAALRFLDVVVTNCEAGVMMIFVGFVILVVEDLVPRVAFVAFDSGNGFDGSTSEIAGSSVDGLLDFLADALVARGFFDSGTTALTLERVTRLIGDTGAIAHGSFNGAGC